MLSVRPTQESAPQPDAGAPQGPFFPVGTFKFALMSFCTLGMYEYYWFYHQWRRIREREREDLSPFWRAFFGPLWAFSLLPRLEATVRARRLAVGWSAGLLATTFFVWSWTWRLPDPWSLVSLLTFLPLLPVVSTLEDANKASGTTEDPNRKLGALNSAGCIIGGLVVLLAIVGTFLPA